MGTISTFPTPGRIMRLEGNIVPIKKATWKERLKNFFLLLLKKVKLVWVLSLALLTLLVLLVVGAIEHKNLHHEKYLLEMDLELAKQELLRLNQSRCESDDIEKCHPTFQQKSLDVKKFVLLVP